MEQRINAALMPLRLAVVAAAILLSASACAAPATLGDGEDFDYAWLKGRAHGLAQQDYQAPNTELPTALQNLDWDQYQQLAFDADQALWKGDEDALFRAELFHLGLYFQQPIRVYQLQQGQAREIAYQPRLFNYGDSEIKPSQLPADLGFAGFRLKFHSDWQRDVVAFLGASYFRAVGSDMQYGLSARGLAVDTALPRDEEFPVFTHFWLQAPAPGSDTAVVYALLDSPSVTGAYRFEIQPGEPLRMRVDAAIYPRQEIERLGIAPLTSMYMVGENSRRANWDWRQEIHDSDGLAMHTGAGQWLWRPLSNPRQLRFNAFGDRNPKGFGLLQRDRDFDHYQDDGVFYERRPSLWIAPRGEWGEGELQLVEIPTEDETFDNIVAFWKPAQDIVPGQELLFSYDMQWGRAVTAPGQLATAVDTFTGIGGVVGKKREYYSRRFVVDFKGDQLAMLGEDAEVKMVLRHSAGEVELKSLRPQQRIEGLRAMFDVVPAADSEAPIDLSLRLELNGKPISETWVYQWSPPPVGQRELHNPGHLK